MDGVLAEVSASYRQAIISTAQRYNITINKSDIQSAKAKGNCNNDWLLTRKLIEEKSEAGAKVSNAVAIVWCAYVAWISCVSYKLRFRP